MVMNVTRRAGQSRLVLLLAALLAADAAGASTCAGPQKGEDTYGRLRSTPVAACFLLAYLGYFGPDEPHLHSQAHGSWVHAWDRCCFVAVFVLLLKRIGTRTRIRRRDGAFEVHRAGMTCGSGGPNTHTR